jgi:hypothetical protein
MKWGKRSRPEQEKNRIFQEEVKGLIEELVNTMKAIQERISTIEEQMLYQEAIIMSGMRGEPLSMEDVNEICSKFNLEPNNEIISVIKPLMDIAVKKLTN